MRVFFAFPDALIPPSLLHVSALSSRIETGPTIAACAPATYPPPYRIRHWPEPAYPPQRESERSRRTRTVDSTLSFHAFPHTSCLETRSPLLAISLLSATLSPSPLDCRIPIAHRTPRSLRAGATAISTARPAWPRAYPAVASRIGRCAAFRTDLELPRTSHQLDPARCDLLHTYTVFALSI